VTKHTGFHFCVHTESILAQYTHIYAWISFYVSHEHQC